MSVWTAARLRQVLDAHDRAGLNALARDLMPTVLAGRAVLLAKRPYFQAGQPSKEDDVQEVLVALFRDDARLLRKFDPAAARAGGDGADDEDAALRRFIIGVAWNVLQRAYTKRRLRWEVLREDLLAADADPGLLRGFARLARVMDLERAIDALAPADQALLAMIYVEEKEQAECCAALGVGENAFQARKSRLLKRLRAILASDEAVGVPRRAHG